MSVKYKKDRSSTGQTTYTSGLTIGSNPYILNIKPVKFSEHLGTAKKFLKWEYYTVGDKKHSFQIKADITERLRTPWNSPGEDNLPNQQGLTNMCQARTPEEAEQIDGGIQTLQWCERPKGGEQINQDEVTENTQPNKQTKPGDGTHPNLRSHAVRWTPPQSHVGSAEGYTRPL